MAELKTPKGLVVGIIPDEIKEQVKEPEKPVATEKPVTRGRKPKEKE